VGKGRALELFLVAEKVDAPRASAIGLVDLLADEPVTEALRQLRSWSSTTPATNLESPT